MTKTQSDPTALPYPKGVRRTTAPKRTFHRGRTWDSWWALLPRGYKVLAHLDTTWGTHFYWQDPIDGGWRKAEIYAFDVGETFDLREERYGVQIGQKVKLKPEVTACEEDAEGVAQIVAFYDDIDGGLRLDKELAGFVSWNISDVVPIVDRTIRFGHKRF